MPIFQISKEKLIQIKEEAVKLEKEIQKLTEQNLELIFGLQFVSSEFQHNALRIDTLAFDKESNAFVIIEYKRDKSFSIIDQGYAYLALMLNNKAEFILEYNERTGKNLKRDDVDWSQSRVLFLANSFTPYQLNAINFKDLPIELHEVKLYDNKTVLYNQLKSPDTKESVKTISKDKTIEHVSREVKVYTIDYHLEKVSDVVKDLFFRLREPILSFGDEVHEEPRKLYIAYKTTANRNFVDIVLFQGRYSEIDCFLNINSGELKDPSNIAIDLTKPKKGHWGNGDYKIKIDQKTNLNYVMELVRQSYEKNK